MSCRSAPIGCLRLCQDQGALHMIYRTAAVMAFLSITGSASAQTTNCMSMGSNMVNCNSSDGSNTNCMSMGGTMVTCNTTGGPKPMQSDIGDGGDTTGAAGVVSFVRALGERSFRSKIGKMLSAGDCEGAARYAYEKGRLELGSEIRKQCAPQAAGVASRLSSVEADLAQIAANAKTPGPLSDQIMLTEVKARGTQLLLTGVVRVPNVKVTPQDRADMTAELCSENRMLNLFRNGATVRTVVLEMDGSQVAALLVGAADCGLTAR